MFWGSPIYRGTPFPAVLLGCRLFPRLRFETCCGRRVLAGLQAGGTREFPPSPGTPADSPRRPRPPALRCWNPGEISLATRPTSPKEPPHWALASQASRFRPKPCSPLRRGPARGLARRAPGRPRRVRPPPDTGPERMRRRPPGFGPG